MYSANDKSRRKFIRQTTLTSAALMLAGPADLFAATSNAELPLNTRSRGYAAKDSSGMLSPWEFERRPVGDHDILIDIKYASICHSDIHQIRGDWGAQQYPQVPGHEISGIVAAVGKKVSKFKVGDRAGVGCLVDSCMECDSCQHGEEQHCDNGKTIFTYGYPEKSSPTGISQGGYSNNIVIKEHFAIHIPDHISFQQAAPLLCAGITTYSPLIKENIKKGYKVGVAGIGGLGHMAIKIAASKGADVYAFTTSPDKVEDILAFGAKEAIVVDDPAKLKAYNGKLDYMISTIPAAHDLGAYLTTVKPKGTFTQVGMPNSFEVTLSILALASSQINLNSSMCGGIPETQEMINYCADHKLFPQVEVIKAEAINDAWKKVVNKQSRYRYVIDAATF
ncbi:MAG: NAD(P)-dependent alcohol dehydrogenase [Sphingobacteriales bacterium]|nr:NAD(P)-dependent alcohol dehydrogenase [Sphingobacteriales bacterium]OJW00148.1 MAG: Zn-dependent alcohol dehydrogenase [Sphingobacteriales bacterium 44-61]